MIKLSANTDKCISCWVTQIGLMISQDVLGCEGVLNPTLVKDMTIELFISGKGN